MAITLDLTNIVIPDSAIHAFIIICFILLAGCIANLIINIYFDRKRPIPKLHFGFQLGMLDGFNAFHNKDYKSGMK